MTKTFVRGIAAAALIAGPAAQSQTADSVTLERRAIQVAAMMNGVAMNFDTVFAPVFLAQVPAAQLRSGMAQMQTQIGRIDRTVYSKPAPSGQGAVIYQLLTEKGFTVPMTLHIAAATPNLIDGLFLAPPVRNSANFDDLAREISALPGHASLLAARVDGSRLVPLAVADTGRPLAIGSAFKLYVLAELLREINGGTRHWSDVVPLDSASRSLPSGMLQGWPANTPVTVQTIAQLMIAISDNTAADRLLHLLGRNKVEAIQSVAGNTHAAMNVPFLSTREMFALKTARSSAQLRRYIDGPSAVRSTILGDLASMPYDKIAPDFSAGPVAPDSVEWFASASDLGRTLVWLRDQSAKTPGATVRDILGVNRGLNFDAASWRYVGFKGGSEPGVLSMSFLLQRTDGQWFVLVAEWNNRDKVVDQSVFVGLITRASELLAK